MKKTTNKARVKKAQLEALCDFIDRLNSRINDTVERAEKTQEKINSDPDNVYYWDKNWLQDGSYDDELTAYENLLKDLEKLI